eukprot:TRINITY_DN8691_c0_g1_i2.p3 TRINITY_DN8691_c0_g1~~TRINITY_DN8691_c0_g1_i2.p3  ORF type:complete len:201 (+),score=34.33 TRINITY_DN8691_c0_g1_i2:438-1040(+)
MLKGRENFLQFYEVFEEEECVIMITELVDGGDLYQKLKQVKKFTEQQTLQIFKQIIIGLEYLQAVGIVHRDLKLENILIKSKVESDNSGYEYLDFTKTIIKIADFGLSDIIKNKKLTLKTRCGTPGYIAPEIFGNSGYNEKVDIFSAGIILYTLINGSPPYKGKDMKTIVKKTKTQKIHFKKTYLSQQINSTREPNKAND